MNHLKKKNLFHLEQLCQQIMTLIYLSLLAVIRLEVLQKEIRMSALVTIKSNLHLNKALTEMLETIISTVKLWKPWKLMMRARWIIAPHTVHAFPHG